MSAQTKGLAALLAAHGRNGDTELVHATKGEIAALNRIKRGIDGSNLPRNPKTGLTEANFFRDYAPQLGMAAGAGLGVALAPFTAGTSLALTPAVAGAIGGAAGGGLGSVARGDDTQNALINTAAGGLGGYGLGSMAAGLGATGGATVATGGAPATGSGLVAPANATNTFALPTTATGAPADVALTGAPGGATGETLSNTNLFSNSMNNGVKLYEGGGGGSGLQIKEGVGLKPDLATINSPGGVGTPPAVTTPTTTAVAPTPAAEPYTGSGLQPRPGVGIKPELGTTSKTDYLLSKDALGDALPVATSAAAMTPGANDVTTDTAGIDRTLPKSEVYYTPTGERRTRVVDRPQYGNVNMARGGDVYGDYEGVDEAPDGGYHPGGGLNYAGGGIAGTGWGEQTRGGFSGLTESLQPGGALGEWHGKLYGALGADQVMPGGAMGSLIPGANQYNAQKRKEDERKRAEEEAGIAAAAKAKQQADFEQKWDERYSQGMAEGGYTGPRDGDAIRAVLQEQNQERDRQNQLESYRALWPIASVSGHQKEAGEMRAALQADEDKRNAFNSPAIRHVAGYPQQQMAGGGIANLGHYSDGGQLLRGPGDGVSDSIPASIEGKRPARLADGEFVVPARAVSELGNGSTEAGSKQLYAMLDRIAKKRKSGKGLAYQANPKKMLPA